MYVASLPSSATATRPPATPKPTNYVYIKTDKAIKGHYVIDPSLSVPRYLLPPLDAGESEDDRKNVKFESIFGGVDASISLLGDAQDPSVDEAKLKKRTSLDVKCEHGSIKLRLRTCSSATAAPMPFHLNITGCHGSVNVALPRTFQGPMTIYSSHGSVKFSDDVSERMGHRNEIDNTRRCFVGDLSLLSDDDDGWKGDEVNIRTEHSSVKVRFVDEPEPEIPTGKAGLISRLLGAML